MQNISIKNKRLIIISILVFCLLIIIFLIYQIILNNKNQKVIISNFSSCIKDISSENSNSVAKTLYSFVNSQNNVNNISNSAYYEGIIRQDTCKTADKAYESHNTIVSNADFILDIPSNKYSYRVKFSWVKPQNNLNESIDLGTTSIYCLKSNESIYPEFKCSDNPTISTEIDPIFKLDLNREYNCWANFSYSEIAPTNTKIQITYYPSDQDYINNTVDEFGEECIKYIKSKITSNGLNLDDYEITSKLQIFR